MINFLRIVNNIKIGDYLHFNGQIDNTPSSDIIGICVISSNFLPDRLARFMSIQQSVNDWNININIDNICKKRLPGKELDEQGWGFLDGIYPALVSPYLSDGSFNPDFLKDLKEGNVFQDYKGYENTEKYKKKYGNSKYLENAFSGCFRISPSYRKSEWYLPSVGELALLPERRYSINSAITAGSLGIILSVYGYWSSTEYNPVGAWSISMGHGGVDTRHKINLNCVRAFLAL